MADKPSRALVFYGDGLARFVNSSHSYLHSLASRACCGFLSLPHSPPSESTDVRIVREFAHLLDASEAYDYMCVENTAKGEECTGKFSLETVSKRFMGMKAAIITNNSSVKLFGGKLGFTVLELNNLMESSYPLSETKLDIMACKLLKLLGFEEGMTLETSQFELVFLHVEYCEKIHDKGINYMNELIGRILNIAPPGSEIASRVHLSVVLSYGAVLEDDDSSLSVSSTGYENYPKLSMLFPRQSYTIIKGNTRKNVRHHSPMLVAQWQNAVTRKDNVQTFCFSDFKENGGNRTIPADRFIHEVAFKLWKAPKYGA